MSSWEDQRNTAWEFPVVVQHPVIQMSRIHPLQQCKVMKVVTAIENDPRVDCVVLFGSSTNIRCNIRSDVDLVVKLKDVTLNVKNEVSEKIQEACDWGADILWYDRLEPTDRVFQEMRTGVKIYE